MSDMAEGQQTAPEATETAPDPVLSRLDEMQAQLGKLSQASAPKEEPGPQRLADVYAEGSQSQEPEYQDDPYGFQQDQYQPGQYEPDPYVDPQVQQQQALAQLKSLISDEARQIAQQTIDPYIKTQKAEQLEAKYPEIKENPGKYVQLANQWANRLGRPEMAREPEVIELVYLAEAARSSAMQETPADGGNGVHLESGGAAPQGQEEDAGDAMLKAFGIDPRAAA